MRHGENHYLSISYLVDYRERELSNDNPASLSVEGGPPRRGLYDQAEAALDLTLEIGSQGSATNEIPGKGLLIVCGCARMKPDITLRHGLAFLPWISPRPKR
jgi:hypothetical protein